MTSNLAIIPARGGSKRLPRKNILPLDNVPLLAHTIHAALKSELFERVVVSTEDSEIAQVARLAGAEVLDRPLEYASDSARVRDVCQHTIEQLIDSRGKMFDSFCVLTATSALRTELDIIESYQVFTKGHDFVISVTDYFFYPHAAIVVGKNGLAKYYWPEIALAKGQEIPSLVVENGAINWCRTDAFLNSGELMGENTGVYRMPKMRSIDVDTAEDYQVMLAIHGALKKGQQKT